MFCNERAQAGGRGGNYVGWLATSQAPAAGRIAGHRGWVRLDGLPFADSPASLLTTGQVFYPVVFNELGVDQDTVVMTGTRPDGTYDPGNSCQDWTTLTPQQNYLLGDTTFGSGGWTSVFISSCDASNGILCFEVDYDTPVTYAPATGRVAFLSASWVPSGGLAGADAACQQEAMGAGLPGMYRALLATDQASAGSRMNLAGTPWVRTDGIPLVAKPSDLIALNLLSALDVAADGKTYLVRSVWAGAVDLGTQSPMKSCSGWTSGSSNLMTPIGFASASRSNFFVSGYSDTCAGADGLYCLQQ
jgi:hypothetical protein